jgi:hypothetical protein
MSEEISGMSWPHERVIDGFHEGTTLPRIRDYLVNEDGVRIEPIGARGFWVFKYTHGDLQIEFDAGSTTLSESDFDPFSAVRPRVYRWASRERGDYRHPQPNYESAGREEHR